MPKPGVDRAEAQGWLIEGLTEVAAYATEKGVVPCLEPEPGMLVETLDDFAALKVAGLRLALDTGHCLVTGERDPAAAVREFAPRIGTVAIEDMKRGGARPPAVRRGRHGRARRARRARRDPLRQADLRGAVAREPTRADAMIPASLEYLRTCRREGPALPEDQETRRQ